MTWVLIVLAASVALGLGYWLAREGRKVWSLFAAAMVFALAGYAAQGRPDLAAAPDTFTSDLSATPEGVINLRRGFYNSEGIMPSRFVVVADGFSRQGQHVDAAGMLRNAVTENPDDAEAWLALAMALTAHTKGEENPPVLYAFQRARQTAPDNLAPGYFRGLARLQSGELVEAAQLWREALETTPEDARGRAFVSDQLARLEQVMRTIAERQEGMPAPFAPGAQPPQMPPPQAPAQE